MAEEKEYEPKAAEAAENAEASGSPPQSSESMRREIENTRASIGEKLDALKDKALNVQTKALEALDLKHQLSLHPWAAVGASVAVGFVAGSIGGGAGARAPGSRSWLRTIRADLFEALKLAAAAALTEVARQALTKHMPAVGEQLEKVWVGQGLTSVSVARALLDRDRLPPSKE